MGTKLAWVGLYIVVALKPYVPHADIVGAIIMGIGVVMLVFDK